MNAHTKKSEYTSRVRILTTYVVLLRAVEKSFLSEHRWADFLTHLSTALSMSNSMKAMHPKTAKTKILAPRIATTQIHQAFGELSILQGFRKHRFTVRLTFSEPSLLLEWPRSHGSLEPVAAQFVLEVCACTENYPTDVLVEIFKQVAEILCMCRLSFGNFF